MRPLCVFMCFAFITHWDCCRCEPREWITLRVSRQWRLTGIVIASVVEPYCVFEIKRSNNIGMTKTPFSGEQPIWKARKCTRHNVLTNIQLTPSKQTSRLILLSLQYKTIMSILTYIIRLQKLWQLRIRLTSVNWVIFYVKNCKILFYK